MDEPAHASQDEKDELAFESSPSDVQISCSSDRCLVDESLRLEYRFNKKENIDTNAIRQFVQKSIQPEIESIRLTLAGCEQIDNVAILLLAFALPPSLRDLKLDLAGCTQIDNEGLTGLSRKLPNALETLVLDMSSLELFKSTMSVSDEGFYALAQSLPQHLTHLELHFGSCSQIGNEGVFGLAAKLPPTLHAFALSLTGCGQIDYNGVQALANGLPSTLRSLDLVFFGCKEVGDSSLLSLVQKLPQGLTTLKLNFNCCDKVTNAGIVGLAKALPASLVEATFDFGFCDIDSSIRERTESLQCLRRWQDAMRVQDEALASPGDAKLTEAVVAFLSHEDWLIRKDSVKVLANLQEAAIPHLPSIIKLLGDDEYRIWPHAAEALNSILSISPDALSQGGLSEGDIAQVAASVAEYLADEEDDVRQSAVETLCSLGTRAAPHVDALAGCLTDDEEDVRAAAAKALGRIGAAAIPHAPALANCLADDESEVRLNAAEALGTLGESSGQFAETFVKQLGENDRDRRLAAMEVLGSMGQAAAPHIAFIAKCFRDQDWKVRLTAAKAMGQLGAAALPYANDLASLVDDRDLVGPRQIDVGMEVREAAADALCRLPRAVLEAVSNQSLTLMTVASCQIHCPALAKRCEEVMRYKGDKIYAKELVGLLRHEEWRTRVGAIEALGQLGPALEPHAAALMDCLDDPRLNVRLAAAESLLKLPSPENGVHDERCRAWGLVAFSEGDPQIAARARAALTNVSNVQRATALAMLIEHKNMKVRKGAVEAFAQLGDAAVPYTIDLIKRLADERQFVQKAVISTLDFNKDYVARAPPVICGHLWKQSPSKLRLGAYQRRWVMVRDAKIFWWSSQEKATQCAASDTGSQCKGYIDLRANPCVIEVLPNLDLNDGPSQRFVLKAAEGKWSLGSFTGVKHGREFQFDAKESEYVAQGWIYVMKAHISYAARESGSSRSRQILRASSCIHPDDKRGSIGQVQDACLRLSRAKSATVFDDKGGKRGVPSHWNMR